jgi:hypothetical protein
MADYDDDPTMSAPEIIALAGLMHPYLAGRHPAEQGAVLCELLSLWLAGHPEEMREEVLGLHLVQVRALIPLNAAMLREREAAKTAAAQQQTTQGGNDDGKDT